ncbi:MAG TPA: rhodanese-like domain-containing protein [Prosthecobacter sp.]
MSTITAADLHQLLQERPAQNVIDVRTPVEFAEVHVEGAKNIPLGDLRPEDLHESYKLSIEKPIYILCRSGQRATKAAEQLAKSGFPNSVVVEGGTLAWVAAGLPVKREKVSVISLERQVRIGAGSLVLTGVALGWFVHPGFLGISAFVGAGLVFAGITDWCGMGLLLAKAPWNQKAS